jgi:hypothetical protein
MDIKPLDTKISRCVINGQILDIMTYDEYSKNPQLHNSSVAIIEELEDSEKIVLPYRGKCDNANPPSSPGIYNAGCIDFCVYPNESVKNQYIPDKIIELDNHTAMKDILEKEEVMSRLNEPWITSPDNITSFPICQEDKPEMKCLKSALNEKHIDFDKYSVRFGQNFPNDKRQLKNNSATLNIIKRFCDKCDMEAILVLRDKNPNVPNPIGKEISVSLTDDYVDDDED